MGNIFWCYMRKLFVALAFRECNRKDTQRYSQGQDFCPLKKLKLLDFLSDFALNFFEKLSQ